MFGATSRFSLQSHSLRPAKSGFAGDPGRFERTGSSSRLKIHTIQKIAEEPLAKKEAEDQAQSIKAELVFAIKASKDEASRVLKDLH